LRSEGAKKFFQASIADNLIAGVDVEQQDSLLQAFIHARPAIVVNCIGLVKQLAEVNDPLRVIPINTVLPHRLAKLCELTNARLIHISTDCVFSGEKGQYRESDFPDAQDLYGRSKYLGEVSESHAVTLRTSIIGHELNSSHGLVEWFLSQGERCEGYAKVIFSGVPAVVLAKAIRDAIIPRPELSGVYHLAAKPISKYELLKLIAKTYQKKIEVVPDNRLAIDRSLDPGRLLAATGYSPPEWEEMIELMNKYR
jgi:dTDP-4-dehydrorhamnose reductase